MALPVATADAATVAFEVAFADEVASAAALACTEAVAFPVAAALVLDFPDARAEDAAFLAVAELAACALEEEALCHVRIWD